MTELQCENSNSDHTSEDYPVSLQKDFKWNSKQKIALLNGMINLKPAGVHKHLNMLLIREDVSKNLKKTVPTAAIWKYLHSYWDTDIADNIERSTVTLDKENFDLPKDEEWMQLIQEQMQILNLNISKDAVGKEAVGNTDSKLLKSVKVMVEKLDSPSSLINCLKSNNVLNWEKTLKNSPNDFHSEGTTSNLNIDVKLSGNIDLNSDDLEEYTVKNQSTDVLKRSVNSDKYFKNEKKRCISLSDTCNQETPILARSTSPSHSLTYNSDTEVNSIKSDSVSKKKITLSRSLRSLNISATM